MRKPRLLQDGARYHVGSRGHQKRHLFQTVREKQLFLSVLARAKVRFGFRLENLCILSNHFHAIIRPRLGTSLSRILQWILSVFAQAWNRLHDLQDRVWGPRFFSRVLEGIRAFIAVFRYIDLNPVKARLVNAPEDWPFGGPAFREGRRGLVLDSPEEDDNR